MARRKKEEAATAASSVAAGNTIVVTGDVDNTGVSAPLGQGPVGVSSAEEQEPVEASVPEKPKTPKVQGVFVLRGAGSYATAAFPGFYAVRNRPFPVIDPALADHLRRSALFEELR